MNGDSLPAAQRVLLEEACRIANRLDTLDNILDGRQEEWMRFHSRDGGGTVVEVVLDKALAEARQQATALRGLMAELRAAGAAVKPQPGGKVAGVADLASFAATRSAKATG